MELGWEIILYFHPDKPQDPQDRVDLGDQCNQLIETRIVCAIGPPLKSRAGSRACFVSEKG